LFESAPVGTDVDEVLTAIQGVEGVRSVHDLHVWTIGGGLDALWVSDDVLRASDHAPLVIDLED
jgi:cobalt-zinc-cadmium efflux system protein